MKKLLVIFGIIGFAVAGWSQDTTANQDIFGEMDAFIEETGKAETLENISQELEAVEQSQNLRIKIDEYRISSLDHRKEVFQWQLKASKWIFVIVMAIVLSGLALSYMHFYKSLKNPPGTEGEKTELEMSTSGIKMNSSVIGLIILVLAIAFLYLYLVHVFPINEFNVDTNAVPNT